jgi:hypothetical protein
MLLGFFLSRYMRVPGSSLMFEHSTATEFSSMSMLITLRQVTAARTCRSLSSHKSGGLLLEDRLSK